MFIKVLGKIKDFYAREPVKKECIMFWIHCNMTTSFLLGMTAILGCSQLVGNPIYCQIPGIPKKIANLYCWMLSTFAMPESFNRVPENRYLPAHPGVTNDFGKHDDRKYYAYYQWVPVVLFLQALCCYAPKYFWNGFERDRMKGLTTALTAKILSEEEQRKEKQALVTYLLKYANKHDMYALVYFFCEFLCFVNVILQFYFMDVFFHGDFINFGFNMLFFDELPQESRMDYMVYIFPEVTKCVVLKIGPSGTLQRKDGLCYLALNRVNQKTYVFLYFWLVALAVSLGFVVLLRLVDMIFPNFRMVHVVEFRDAESSKLWQRMLKKISFGDRWIIYMLSLNLNKLVLSDIVTDFVTTLDLKEDRAKMRV